jgi:hypothetical protein
MEKLSFIEWLTEMLAEDAEFKNVPTETKIELYRKYKETK